MQRIFADRADAGRKLAAALVPATGETSDDELAAAVKEANATLAAHQRVGSWRRWPEDDLPRTHTLKVRRGPVQQWMAGAEPDRVDGGRPPQAGPAATSTVTVESVARVVANVLHDTRNERPGLPGRQETTGAERS